MFFSNELSTINNNKQQGSREASESKSIPGAGTSTKTAVASSLQSLQYCNKQYTHAYSSDISVNELKLIPVVGTITISAMTSTSAKMKNDHEGNVNANPFSGTSNKVSRLETKLIETIASLQHQVDDIRSTSTSTSTSKCTSKSAKIKTEGECDGMKMKSHVLQASAFLQAQNDKLSSIESSLPPLVDMLLGECKSSNHYNRRDMPKSKSKSKSKSVSNHNKRSMSELASTCLYLHSMQAKQLLHLESTLVHGYGYIPASQREDDDDMDDRDCNYDYNYNPNDSHGNGMENTHVDGDNEINVDVDVDVDGDIPTTPSWMKPSHESQSYQNQYAFHALTPHHQKLPRLSEATLETDAGSGTPGSVMTIGNGNGNGGTGTCMNVVTGSGNKMRRESLISLTSLVEEVDDMSMEFDDGDESGDDSGNEFTLEENRDETIYEDANECLEEISVMIERDGDGDGDSGMDNGRYHTSTPSPIRDDEEEHEYQQEQGRQLQHGTNGTPKTPSMADLKLRYVPVYTCVHECDVCIRYTSIVNKK